VNVFKRQIDFLNKFYEIAPLNSIIHSSGKRTARTKIAITFDDGYRCIYEHAYPILKRKNIPATVFLPVNCIENNLPIWTDMVKHYIGSTKTKKIELLDTNYKLSFDLVTLEDKLNAIKQIKKMLKSLPNDQRIERLEELKKQTEVLNTDNNLLQMCSWKEIKEMSEHNITFGGHTMNHPILSSIPLLDTVRYEVNESKKIIENKTSKLVSAFAYPNGQPEDFNDDIKKIVKGSGYKLACTTIFGKNDTNTDPYELKRIYTSGDSLLRFAFRLMRN